MTQAPSQSDRFRSVYAAHHGAVRDYCFRRLPVADANDASAEVFLVVWRRIDDVPSGDDAALPWLYGIARNVVSFYPDSHIFLRSLAHPGGGM